MLTKSMIKSIVKDYDFELQNYMIFEKGSVNTNIKLSSSSQRFFLKIMEVRNESELKFQIDLLDYLEKKNFKTPRVVRTKNGDSVQFFENKPVVVYSFLSGENIESYDKELADNVLQEIVRLQKEIFYCTFQNKPWVKLANDFQLEDSWLEKINDQKLSNEFSKIKKEVESLNFSMMRKGIIHGDFSDTNMLAKDNKVSGIVDFDEVRFDYLVYDIAIFLTQTCFCNSQFYKENYKNFLMFFTNSHNFNQEEAKAVPILMKRRSFSSVLFYAYRTKTRIGNQKNNLFNQKYFENVYSLFK